MDSIPHKTCARCKQVKPTADFGKNARYRDGCQSYCKACMKSYQKQWEHSPENEDRRREYQAKWYQENKGRETHRRRAYDKRRWHTDPKYRQKKNQWQRDHFQNNPEYRVRRIGQRKAAQHKRRKHIKESIEHFTSQEWRDLCEHYDHHCLRCGKVFDILSPDHVIPVSKGGGNGINNIQPLCWPCNRSKGNKTIDYRPMWVGGQRYPPPT
jgi:5-methylcytosine-specific restriction endonuclease McrA